MSVTTFHNPACGTSRNVLALIRHCTSEDGGIVRDDGTRPLA